tara:strand:+ start:39 stop:185 length:147 start_codon:yes stop_codon:yes gene_type:complete
MSNEAYEEVMKYLTCIEEELNKVAAAVGHVSFDEFMTLNSNDLNHYSA